jgi:hypothetical protein
MMRRLTESEIRETFERLGLASEEDRRHFQSLGAEVAEEVTQENLSKEDKNA